MDIDKMGKCKFTNNQKLVVFYVKTMIESEEILKNFWVLLICSAQSCNYPSKRYSLEQVVSERFYKNQGVNNYIRKIFYRKKPEKPSFKSSQVPYKRLFWLIVVNWTLILLILEQLDIAFLW